MRKRALCVDACIKLARKNTKKSWEKIIVKACFKTGTLVLLSCRLTYSATRPSPYKLQNKLYNQRMSCFMRKIAQKICGWEVYLLFWIHMYFYLRFMRQELLIFLSVAYFSPLSWNGSRKEEEDETPYWGKKRKSRSHAPFFTGNLSVSFFSTMAWNTKYGGQ